MGVLDDGSRNLIYELKNYELLQAIDAIYQGSSETAQGDFFKTFCQSKLLIACNGGVQGPAVNHGSTEAGWMTAQAGASIAMATLSRRDGAVALPAFTDYESMQSRQIMNPEDEILLVDSSSVVDMFLNSDCDYIVVNPGSEQGVELNRAHVEHLVSVYMHSGQEMQSLVDPGSHSMAQGNSRLPDELKNSLKPIKRTKEEPEEDPENPGRKFKLSKREKEVLKELIEAVPESEVPVLRNQVLEAVNRIGSIASGWDGPSSEVMDQIANRAMMLLDGYGKCSKREKALIVGAVRYFWSTEDAIPDWSGMVGLDDDARVMNFVLEELGLERAFISLDE